MPFTGLGRARRFSVVAGAGAAMVLTMTPAATQAAPAPLAGGVRTVGVTSSSMTVGPKTAWSPGRYRILASTSKASMKLSSLRNTKKSAATTQKVLTLSGLTYSTKPYYYRVRAKVNGKKRYSPVRSVYLRPPTPKLRVVGSSTTGLALLWDGPSATRYVVIRAQDPSMTEGRVAVSLDARQRQYTPLDLVPGTQYWFSLQAYNKNTASVPSAPVTAVATAAGVTVRTMTYNILRAERDGTLASGTRVAPWSSRKIAAAALIRRADPDVLALQEASDWAYGSKGARQVDDLRATLGNSTYSLARTEVPPSEAFYFRTGRYILYKTNVLRAVGAGGFWTIGTKRYAAYQILEHLSTGARFLAVSVHLEPGGKTRTLDLKRQAQTRVLLSKVSSFLANRPMPVMYLGDFNSHERHIIDGPATVMGPAHIADSDDVARAVVNRSLNSANQYLRRAPTSNLHVDHVYVSPGIGVRRFEVVANVSSGSFVGTIPSDHNPLAVDVVLPYPSS